MTLVSVPPPQVMVQMLGGFQISQALYVLAVLGVPDELVDGPRTAEDLARTVGAQPDPLHRMLRTLASLGVFEQLDEDTFGLTPVGETLTSTAPTSVRDLALTWMETHYAAFGELLQTARTGRPAATVLYGMPFFDWLGEHPEHADRFTRAMGGMTQALKAAAIPSVDLSGATTVVDVGGADGEVLAIALAQHPGVRGVVLDLPHVVDAAVQNMRRHGLSDRVQAVGGDFFTSVPEADTYLFSLVLHDWDDEEAVRILSTCRDAGGPGCRVRALEFVVPSTPEPHPAKMMDITMLGMLTGKERSESQWAAVAERSGMRLDRVVATPTPLSVLEATAV
jgi:hypothetical protein